MEKLTGIKADITDADPDRDVDQYAKRDTQTVRYSNFPSNIRIQPPADIDADDVSYVDT